jgi:threonine dehydrogenase-like Zn-dependent dehydrogenase
MPYGHYSHFVANEHDNFVVLPDDFDPALGIFVSKMGPICMNGILYAADEVHRTLVTELTGSLPNERVLVFGAGIVGLLVGMMAKWAGAREVLIVDGIQERLDIAENLGLTPIPATDLLPQVIKKRWSTPDRPLDTGADIVFQCTGSDALLSQALSCLREQGTVIDLGFYQQGTANVFLGKEFHHNRLRHICAQIGGTPRHQQPFWTRPQLAKETIKFLHEYGAALKEHAITHQMPFSQAQDAYDRLLHRDHSMLQVVLHPDMPDAPAAKTSDVSQHSTEAAS